MGHKNRQSKVAEGLLANCSLLSSVGLGGMLEQTCTQHATQLSTDWDKSDKKASNVKLCKSNRQKSRTGRTSSCPPTHNGTFALSATESWQCDCVAHSAPVLKFSSNSCPIHQKYSAWLPNIPSCLERTEKPGIPLPWPGQVSEGDYTKIVKEQTAPGSVFCHSHIMGQSWLEIEKKQTLGDGRGDSHLAATDTNSDKQVVTVVYDEDLIAAFQKAKEEFNSRE